MELELLALPRWDAAITTCSGLLVSASDSSSSLSTARAADPEDWLISSNSSNSIILLLLLGLGLGFLPPPPDAYGLPADGRLGCGLILGLSRESALSAFCTSFTSFSAAAALAS